MSATQAAGAAAAGAIRVRDERPADFTRVHALQSAAFGRPQEAELVAALRSAARPALSLVAEVGDQVVGHVFLAPVRLDAPQAPAAASLGPIGVLPEAQGRGVGAALVRAALARAPEHGWRALFLVGNPHYYARFGFERAAPRGFRYRSARFDPALQLIELELGALRGVRGPVRYHEAFDAVDKD